MPKINGPQELRERLLNDPEIRLRIAARAFELHEIDRRYGWEMDNWLLAENEIFDSLIEAELKKAQMETSSRRTGKRFRLGPSIVH